MSEDRRTTVRRHASLPFAWKEIPDQASMAEACRALGVPAAAALHSRVAELDDEFRRLCATLPDPRVAEAVQLLNDKVALLEEALMSQAPLPPAQPLEVSAEGLGFESSHAVEVGTLIGVHLVLPVSYHLICRARVSRCAPGEHGHQIGVTLLNVEGPASRRLTRYAIGRDRGVEED